VIVADERHDALTRINRDRYCPGPLSRAAGRCLWGESERAPRADRRFALSSSRTYRNRKPSPFTTAFAGPAAAAPAVPPGTSANFQPTIDSKPALGGRRVAAGPRVVLVRAALAALIATLMMIALAPLAPSPASASTVSQRLTALRWAEAQAGRSYCFGGTAGCFDCSGLVMEAYAHAGISLPRTTYGMLASPRLVWIPASQRQRGDLAFYGSGHVELVTRSGTFGAAAPGTQVGWHHPSAWWHPTMYFRVR
jgi:cell wall-associated NlpC family hydrolase